MPSHVTHSKFQLPSAASTSKNALAPCTVTRTRVRAMSGSNATPTANSTLSVGAEYATMVPWASRDRSHMHTDS